MVKKTGAKNRVAVDKSKAKNGSDSHADNHDKLNPQKRNALNQLVDKLLKGNILDFMIITLKDNTSFKNLHL